MWKEGGDIGIYSLGDSSSCLELGGNSLWRLTRSLRGTGGERKRHLG